MKESSGPASVDLHSGKSVAGCRSRGWVHDGAPVHGNHLSHTLIQRYPIPISNPQSSQYPLLSMSSDLLVAALNRATMRDHDARSPPMGSSASAASSEAEHSEDEDDSAYTPVHTRPSTPSGTPRKGRELQHSGLASSHSNASTPAGSRSSSPSRLAKKKLAEEAERRKSRDPLRRFDNDVSSKIFRELDVTSLARCMRVSKRWRRSATISRPFVSPASSAVHY